MTEEKKTPDINVSMGNGNTVGHIGHKITYHAPPPPPNAVFAGGQVIGEFIGQPRSEGNQYIFPSIEAKGRLVEGAIIEVQNVRLKYIRSSSVAEVRMPGHHGASHRDAVCEVVA